MSNAFDEWRRGAKRRRQSVDVCFDETIDAELEQVRAEMAAQRKSGLLDDARRLAERERELLDAAAEATHPITFEGVGPGRLRRLLDLHPPTEEQKKAEKVGQVYLPTTGFVQFNPDTFPPVLMAECCVDPGISEDQAAWLLDLSVATSTEVWAACMGANLGQVTGPKAQSAIGRRLLGETRSTPPPTTESPDQSSSDGASEPSTSTLLDA